MESTRFGTVVRPDIASKEEFCSYPDRPKLNAVRYRECVLADKNRYPDKINQEKTIQNRYADYVKSKGGLGNYENIFFADAVPTSGHPNGAQEIGLIFSNGNLDKGRSVLFDKSNPAESCEY